MGRQKGDCKRQRGDQAKLPALLFSVEREAQRQKEQFVICKDAVERDF